MDEYIFYTTEGVTLAPNQVVINNCQVLGFAQASSLKAAKELLLRGNPWIVENGFAVNEIKGKRIVPFL